MDHGRNDGYSAAQRQMRIQQAKAAAAAEANSPEALAAEAARQAIIRENEAREWRAAERAICDAKGEDYRPEILEPSPPVDVDGNGAFEPRMVPPAWDHPTPSGLDDDGSVPSPRRSRLADKLAEVVLEEEEETEPEPEPDPVMGGAHLVRWILVPAAESDGWTLGFSMEDHTSEEPDAVYLEVTQAMMRGWRNAPQNAHDLERFAAGIMEKVADSLAEDLTDRLIEALNRITTGELREKQYLVQEFTDAPTETAIGPDDDGEVEPFGSVAEYVEIRDSYAQTLSRDEFAAFLDDNQDMEEAVARMANEVGA